MQREKYEISGEDLMMSNKIIPLSVPNISGNEIDYVTRALETEWVSTAGSYIGDFEKKMTEYLNINDAVACQSGTAGIHLALEVSGVKPGDEVIVPTLTFIAAINPIRYLNANPVFMDCNESLTMDPEKLSEFLKYECDYINNMVINKATGRFIKAILVVHVFGNMADMESIVSIAKKYNLKLIEDATEALGTYYTEGIFKGKYAGTIGDIGIFSFNGNKIITTGGGGMVVSSNKNYTEKCRYLSTQAKDDTLYFIHNEIGYNYRMTNLQAAVGLAQMEQLECFIQVKEENYNLYKQLGLKLLDFRKGVRANKWFYSYITDRREELLHYLENKKIQTRPVWKLNHKQKPYLEFQAYKIEKADYYYNHILNLPCSTNLSCDEVETVTLAIQEFEFMNN